MIKTIFFASAALLLAACGNSGPVAPENTAPPSINAMSETPGDWSGLSGLVGRSPGESDLFVSSPITVDLNAMLGPNVEAYRRAMNDAQPLQPEPNGILVSRSASGAGWLVIQPTDHALAAGYRENGKWRVFTTPASEVPLPQDLRQPA